MKTSTLVLISVPLLALVSCAGAEDVAIKPIASKLAAGQQPVDVRVAEGHAQMALGNVGLALEAYRKALRADPGSVDALLGLAAAYDRMGRFDLSRRHYEMALALQPRRTDSLEQLAQSLKDQGRADEAARVNTEIAVRDAAPEALPTVPGSVPVLPPPPAPSVTVALPAAAPAPVAVALPHQSARLERLSMGEVALLTKQGPVWRSAVTQQTARSATITFERKAAPQVALLNAARVQGLAARTRAYLAARGFRNAAIGDAPAVRKQSAILFAEGDRVRAERIAAQFGFALEHRAGSADGRMTILLGRDAAIDRALRPNG